MATTDPTPNSPIRRKRVADDESKYITPSCPPGWAWLLAGIMIGIFISFLVYLREIALHSLPGGNATNSPYVNDNMQATSGSKPSTGQAASDFKFFDILPNADSGKSSGSKPTEPAEAPTEAENSPGDEADEPITMPGRYLLRVVSYRDERMAEGLKGHLATLGITAQVEATPLTADGRWYRVQVGPFTDLDKLNSTRVLLKQNSLDFELIKF